jgi:TonB-linked SusC/RagA family outer membrane protein
MTVDFRPDLVSRFRILAALATIVLVLLGAPATAQAQDGVVQGRVIDTRSLRPVPSVQVAVAGTALATVTDVQGRFQIRGITGTTAALTFRRIGYRPHNQSVPVGGQEVRIEMSETPLSLDELVVTGTAGSTEKRAIGNSVTQIRAAEVTEIAPVSDIGDLLTGRAPGVSVMAGSGMAGMGPRIEVRGRNSISLKGDPLMYIDGVRVSNETSTGPRLQGANYISRLGDLNPNDIESIEIIKGPAAATLYGTEAANGVVQIITKKGIRGDRPTFDLSVRQGANWFMNAEGRMPHNFSREPDGSVYEQNLFEQERAGGHPAIFTTGYNQGYSLNASGGSNLLQYFASVGFSRDEGIEPKNYMKNLGGRTNLTIKPSEKIDISLNLGFQDVTRNLGTQEGASTMWTTLFGSPLTRNTAFRGFNLGPPEVMKRFSDSFQDVERITASIQANHRVTSWLSHRLNVGTDQTAQEDEVLIQRMLPQDAPFFSPVLAAGQIASDRRTLTVQTVDYSASAALGLTSRIKSTTTVGTQFYRNYQERTSALGQGFPVRGLTAVSASTTTTGEGTLVENKTFGVFAQQQFGLNDRFFLTAALRADDNSAFGDDFDLIYYPKVSASWVVSEEPFWKIGAVSALRLRAAYGHSGQQPANFAALRIFTPTVGPLASPAVSPAAFGNSALAPERGEELEVGFEAGLFNDRVRVDFTYYSSRTEKAILLRDVAPSTGFPGQQYVNAGLIKNKGTELQLDIRPIESRRLAWDVGFNVSTNANEIVDLDPNDPSLTFIPITYGRHQEGYPIASWFRRRVASAEFGAGGALANVLCDAGEGQAPLPCSDPRTEIFLGRPTPKYQGGFNTTVTLDQRLRLFAQFDFAGGHRRWDVDTWARCALFRLCEVNVRRLDFPARDVAAAELAGGSVIVDEYLLDAKFLKFRELSLAYSLPERFARAIGGSRASITLAGRNLHTWTPWTGLDPESLVLAGIDLPLFDLYFSQAQIPQLAEFRATLNITF